MADSVHNSTAQANAKSAQPRPAKNQMNTQAQAMARTMASRQAQASFGQILDQNIKHQNLRSVQRSPDDKSEERPEERQDAKRLAKKFAEGRKKSEPVLANKDSRERSHEKDNKSSHDSKDASQHAKEAEQRVVSSREGRGQSGHGQDGRQGDQGAGSQKDTQSQEQGTKKEAPKNEKPLPAWAENSLVKSDLAPAIASPTKLPQAQLQKIVDQIVKYVHLYAGEDGTKEMRLALHDEIFRGLRLAITLKNGKVKASFMTDSREVQSLFLAQRETLRERLEEKGINLEGIDVIMIT